MPEPVYSTKMPILQKKMLFGSLLSSLLLMLNLPVYAESGACPAKADKAVESLQDSFGDLSRREKAIARSAALAACESTFTELESSLQAKSESEGIDPEQDPIGWLKEQWNKEPVKKDGIERLKRRGRY